MDGRWFILLIAALVIIFIIMIFVRRQRREGYNIIFGQAGATKGLTTHYYNCLSECQREDPNKYFTSDAFMRCDYKCSNDITELSEQQKCAESKLDIEDPNRRCAPHVYAMEPKTLVDIPEIQGSVAANDACWAQCGPGREAAECRAWCATTWEIKARCKKDCLHADDPHSCLPKCEKKYSNYTYNPNGWTWKSL